MEAFIMSSGKNQLMNTFRTVQTEFKFIDSYFECFVGVVINVINFISLLFIFS
ncbi:hypothetical protein VCHA37P200_40261 [Vibrio chagasii]|nr:hypothetical protein VCHA53O468_30248 [Vibrio chagasii]CAH7217165.1 hypothetical protein VCHA50O407_20246 [Vibrio chagasii]CAH7293128.1 hypothetical protein VCHA55O507_40262 [Vibrio chagasii]CAH7303276.1 hypothetical protein VCHA50P424_30387 [Vibrio chagasii]CAH7418110.1 hypothetical protein VCHA37P200_40261 [Vibrio chagasii]